MTSAEDATRALSPLLADPARTGVFSDFDGTLAPIVDDPVDARPLPGVDDVLRALVRRMGRVGVISGRPAEFLVDHLGDTGASIWGQYGLERVERDPDDRPRVVPLPAAEEWRGVLDEVVARAERELAEGLGVERKRLTLTLHYRRRPELAAVAREWVERVAGETGLVVEEARMSYELRPPVPHGKGVVLEQAAAGLGAVCFLGDDRGDLDAFDALDRLANAGVAVVRVAVTSEEAPAELLARADLTVEGPAGALAVLRALAGTATAGWEPPAPL